MNNPPLSSARIVQTRLSSAFTLIELLVVISIIAVLAGLLLPVTGAVMENARKADAKSTEVQIVAAVKNFQTEYGVYPVVLAAGATATDTTYDRGSSDNKPLFDILRATDTASTSPNTRRIVYFEGKDAKSTTTPKSGFVPTSTGGTLPAGLVVGDLVDPWGNLYCVRFDSDYSDAVLNPYPATDAGGTASPSYQNSGAESPTNVLRFGAISWSPGKNGRMGNDSGQATVANIYDDVVSWQ